MTSEDQPKKRRGRPLKDKSISEKSPIDTSYKDEKTKQIKALLIKTIKDKGLTLQEARTAIGGIGKSTLAMWLSTDEEFTEKVVSAEMAFKVQIIDQIKEHGKRDWRALAFLATHLPSVKNFFSEAKTEVELNTNIVNKSQNIVVNLINQVIEKTNPSLLSSDVPKQVNLLAEAESDDE